MPEDDLQSTNTPLALAVVEVISIGASARANEVPRTG
jgi:hypothetical protein